MTTQEGGIGTRVDLRVDHASSGCNSRQGNCVESQVLSLLHCEYNLQSSKIWREWVFLDQSRSNSTSPLRATTSSFQGRQEIHLRWFDGWSIKLHRQFPAPFALGFRSGYLPEKHKLKISFLMSELLVYSTSIPWSLLDMLSCILPFRGPEMRPSGVDLRLKRLSQ